MSSALTSAKLHDQKFPTQPLAALDAFCASFFHNDSPANQLSCLFSLEAALQQASDSRNEFRRLLAVQDQSTMHRIYCLQVASATTHELCANANEEFRMPSEGDDHQAVLNHLINVNNSWTWMQAAVWTDFVSNPTSHLLPWHWDEIWRFSAVPAQMQEHTEFGSLLTYGTHLLSNTTSGPQLWSSAVTWLCSTLHEQVSALCCLYHH